MQPGMMMAGGMMFPGQEMYAQQVAMWVRQQTYVCSVDRPVVWW